MIVITIALCYFRCIARSSTLKVYCCFGIRSCIDTGINKRDRHLRSEDFLDASKYPLITFVSSTISKGEENSYIVSGKRTIKGVSSEVILSLRYEGRNDHPLLEGAEVSAFNGQFSLDLLAYLVGDGKYYQMGAVGKDVDNLVTIEVLRRNENH